MEYSSSDKQPPPPAQTVPAGVQPARWNAFAIAALVLGIIWIYWIGSILALVFGYIAKSQIEESGGREQGMGLAIAGIVLGWVGVAILVLIVLLFLLGAITLSVWF
jgi:hypothetical protein